MLIVIEGLDGSGKATQTARLAQALTTLGYSVRQISFPDYQNPSSTLVRMYLNGEVGSLEEVNAYAASSFYSLDRYISYQQSWKADLERGVIVLADRYTTSNFCHQMGKLPPDRRSDYIDWLTDYEYRLLGLPAPDGVIYLDMPPETSQRLLAERYQGDVTKRDLHEANLSYLLQCRSAALFSAETLGWQVIGCAKDDFSPRPIDEIAQSVLDTALAILA